MTLPDYVLEQSAITQIRLGLIGKPGAGKTTAALTFPNPLVLDRDKKLPPGAAVKSIPFYNTAFSKKFGGDREALVNFLTKEAPSKIPPNMTMIIDSWTMFMNCFDLWADSVSTSMFWSAKKNEVDGFAIHADRINYAVEIMTALKQLPHNFIINFHEQIEREKTGPNAGKPSGNIKPLMKGQFADQAAAHMTDFFRQVIIRDKSTSKLSYIWEVLPSDEFFPITSFKSPDRYIPATYEALMDYRAKYPVKTPIIYTSMETAV